MKKFNRLKQSSSNTKLTFKQRQFIEEYIANGGNGQKAALAAYNTQDSNTARAIASENLIKPNIQGYIQSQSQKHEITEGLVLEKLRLAIDSEDPVIMLKACEMAGKYLKMFDRDRQNENLRLLQHVKEISWGNLDAVCKHCGMKR